MDLNKWWSRIVYHRSLELKLQLERMNQLYLLDLGIKEHVIKFKTYSFFLVENFSFIGYINYRDLSIVRNAYKVHFHECYELSKLSPLRNMTEVTVDSCIEVRDVSPLRNVYKVRLCRLSRVKNVNVLTGVHELFIQSCYGVKNVSGLRNTYKLVLRSLPGVSDISALGGVAKLMIFDCRNIRNFSSLRNTVAVFRMDNLFDVSSLANVKKLTMHECPNVMNMETLSSVPFLRRTDLPLYHWEPTKDEDEIEWYKEYHKQWWRTVWENKKDHGEYTPVIDYYWHRSFPDVAPEAANDYLTDVELFELNVLFEKENENV